MTTAREHVYNALIKAGADVRATESAFPALEQWLLWRAEELRSQEKYEEAAWFSRIASEVMA